MAEKCRFIVIKQLLAPRFIEQRDVCDLYEAHGADIGFLSKSCFRI